MSVAGLDNSFTIFLTAVPAADPSMPLLASVAKAADVSSSDTPNTFEMEDACFIASIISLTDVADNLAAVAKVSPI